MRVHAAGEGQPGVSYILFDESEFIMLLDCTPRGDPLARARAAVADFQLLCSTAAAPTGEHDSPPERNGWLRRRATGQQITCCMKLCSRLDLESRSVTVSVSTQPGCKGSGDTIPYPDRDVAIGCAGLLAQILCRE